METTELSREEKNAKIAKILNYFDVTVDFVNEALESTDIYLGTKGDAVSKSYITANNLWCKSEDGSTEERLYIRERILFAYYEENAKDLLLNIYEDAEDSGDTEAKKLIIKQLAKIF